MALEIGNSAALAYGRRAATLADDRAVRCTAGFPEEQWQIMDFAESPDPGAASRAMALGRIEHLSNEVTAGLGRSMSYVSVIGRRYSHLLADAPARFFRVC